MPFTDTIGTAGLNFNLDSKPYSDLLRQQAAGLDIDPTKVHSCKVESKTTDQKADCVCHGNIQYNNSGFFETEQQHCLIEGNYD